MGKFDFIFSVTNRGEKFLEKILAYKKKIRGSEKIKLGESEVLVGYRPIYILYNTGDAPLPFGRTLPFLDRLPILL